MKYFLPLLLLVCSLSAPIYGQSSDELTLRKIYDKALAEGQSYAMLDYLCNKIGARLSGIARGRCRRGAESAGDGRLRL